MEEIPGVRRSYEEWREHFKKSYRQRKDELRSEIVSNGEYNAKNIARNGGSESDFWEGIHAAYEDLCVEEDVSPRKKQRSEASNASIQGE